MLPLLLSAASPRLVVVSSSAHRAGSIAFDDLQSERSSPSCASSPKRVGGSAAAEDGAVARRVWDVSESLTGVAHALRS